MCIFFSQKFYEGWSLGYLSTCWENKKIQLIKERTIEKRLNSYLQIVDIPREETGGVEGRKAIWKTLKRKHLSADWCLNFRPYPYNQWMNEIKNYRKKIVIKVLFMYVHSNNLITQLNINNY